MKKYILRMLSVLISAVLLFPMLSAGSVADAKLIDNGDYSIKFTNSLDWSDLYVYAWDNDGNTLTDAWPGSLLVNTKFETNPEGKDNHWLYVPSNAAGFVVNNGQGAQTTDITDFTQEGYWVSDQKDDMGSYIVQPWGSDYYSDGQVTGMTVYLDPSAVGNDNWYAYTWSDSGSSQNGKYLVGKWDGKYYEFSGVLDRVIFAQSKEYSDYNLNNCANRTPDLEVSEHNLYVLNGSYIESDTILFRGGVWSDYEPPGYSLSIFIKDTVYSYWSQIADNQVMYKNNDGYYCNYDKNLSPGEYYVSISKNDDYASAGTEFFTVDSLSTLNVLFDPYTGKITCETKEAFIADSVIAFGNGHSGFLNNEVWEEYSFTNKLNKDENIYTITYRNVEPDNFRFGYYVNGTQNLFFGVANNGDELNEWHNAKVNGNDMVFGIDIVSDVTLSLDLSGYDKDTMQGAKYMISAVPADGNTEQQEDEPEVEPDEYYLFGYINREEYGEGADDWNVLGDYKLGADGKIKVKFDETSYVGVKSSDLTKWYMTLGYIDENPVTLVDTANYSNGETFDKMMIPGGVEVEIYFKDNGDGTYTLGYTEVDPVPLFENTNRYYFYKPSGWKDANIYWWDGTGSDVAYPGYRMTKYTDSGVYYFDVPVDVTTVMFNSGGDESVYKTLNVTAEYYLPGEDKYGFYPNGTTTCDNMIFVCDTYNPVDGLFDTVSYDGCWFYLYNQDEYSYYSDYSDASLNNALYSGGKFPLVPTDEAVSDTDPTEEPIETIMEEPTEATEAPTQAPTEGGKVNNNSKKNICVFFNGKSIYEYDLSNCNYLTVKYNFIQMYETFADGEFELRYDSGLQLASVECPKMKPYVVLQESPEEHKVSGNFAGVDPSTGNGLIDFTEGGVFLSASFYVKNAAAGDLNVYLTINDLCSAQYSYFTNGVSYLGSDYDAMFLKGIDIDVVNQLIAEPTEAPDTIPAMPYTEAYQVEPTEAPTQRPTQAPTQKPTQKPTQAPTQPPTQQVIYPTQAPAPTPVTPVNTAKKSQKIKASSSIKKTYGAKSFSLKASAKTKLTYKSSDKSVATVNSKGKVKVNGCGKATITITAKANSKYKSASKKVKLTVTPKQLAISGVSKVSGDSIRVKYKKLKGISGYKMEYGFGNSMKSKKTVYIMPDETSETVTGLKKGKMYRFSIRGYKYYDGSIIYGDRKYFQLKL